MIAVIGCCGRFGRGASLYRRRSQLFERLWVRLLLPIGQFSDVTTVISIYRLRAIPPEHMALPALATHCYLSRLQPAHGQTWFQTDTARIAELVANKCLAAIVRVGIAAIVSGCNIAIDRECIASVVMVSIAAIFMEDISAIFRESIVVIVMVGNVAIVRECIVYVVWVGITAIVGKVLLLSGILIS